MGMRGALRRLAAVERKSTNLNTCNSLVNEAYDVIKGIDVYDVYTNVCLKDESTANQVSCTAGRESFTCCCNRYV